MVSATSPSRPEHGALSAGAILYWELYGYFGVLRLILFPANFQLIPSSWHFGLLAGLAALVLALVGVWSSDRTAKSTGIKDPQFVVIDEVSGQFLTYLLALSPANWKYLLLGFILFRVFDIWKPFPARQAESLPGGWGIMADDWIAGIYAAGGLWIARAFGL